MSKSFHKRAFRAYQKVKTLKPARSLFDLTHDVIMSGDMGKLYPTCLMEMSPGDTFHIWQESVTRMMPLNAPILHDIKLNTHYFFVPYRILWEEWIDFITGGVDGDKGGASRSDDQYPDNVTPELPRWEPSEGKNGVGSLWDYCGFPTGVIPEGALPLDFVRRCYNRIWNDYYRDETLQEEIDEANEDILYRNWRKDYFTSALTSQQRGISPAMPLSGNAFGFVKNNDITPTSATWSNVDSDGSYMLSGRLNCTFTLSEPITQDDLNDMSFDVNGLGIWSYIYNPGSGERSFEQQFSLSSAYRKRVRSKTLNTSTSITVVFELYFSISATQTGYQRTTGITSTNVHVFSESVTSNLSNAGNFDVKDLRVAFQIQRWLELANRGGVRYTEFLRSFFGVSPRDDRLQRPEYIGGSSSNIVISEVLQTSSTSSEPTPQGNMAGHGVGASRTYIGSYTAVEFGMIMGLTSIMPSAKYQQGINRQWLRRTKFDFLFPQFTGLSEQAIEQAEIYAEDTELKNRRVFGFNEIYDELRSMPSRIVGKMRTTFDYWHLGRKFDSAPSLNSDFIKCNPSKRIFAVSNEDGFIINIANIIRAVRPIPKYGTPKGV